MAASSTRTRRRSRSRDDRYERLDYDSDYGYDDGDDDDDRGSRSKRKRRKDPLWARLTVIFGALLMVAGGGGIVVARWAIASATSKITTTTLIDSESDALVKGNNINGAINLLLVGIDVEEYDGPGSRDGAVLADSILIMHIPREHNQAYLMSIPRDTRVQIPAYPKTNYRGGTSKINSAFSHGYYGDGTELEKRARGVDLLAQAVNKLTGIQFNGAMLIDFDGFRAIVDELGGVDMCVDQRAQSIHLAYDHTGKLVTVWYSEEHERVMNMPQGGRPVIHEVGCRHMDPALALDYARIRKGLENGDYDRQKNQQKLIKAIAKKATSMGVLTDLGKLNRVIEAGGKAMILDPGRVPIEDFIFTLKDVAANDLITLRTNPGTWNTIDIDGVSYVQLTDVSMMLFRAASQGTLNDFLMQHPEFVTAQ